MLFDVIFTLYKLLAKTKTIVLEKKKHVFKKHFINKEEIGPSKIKSGTENLTSMIYDRVILKLYVETFHFGISILLLLRRLKM